MIVKLVYQILVNFLWDAVEDLENGEKLKAFYSIIFSNF